MEWVELSLPAGDLADELAALLASIEGSACAAGVQVRGEEIVTWVPAAEAEAGALSLRQAAARLAAEGFAVDPAAVRVRPAPPEDEWRDAWKKYFKVFRVTPRLVIVPSWLSYAPVAGDVVLDLDPGRAFGTGAHASTRLCLVELDRLCDGDGLVVHRFLDVGTGSGILAIAAAKLWPAARGEAMDVDPEATSVARENLEHNGVLARVRTSEEALATLPAANELVLANIQADVLESLAAELVAHVAPGGALVLSGLLAEQAPLVAAAFVRTAADAQVTLTIARITTLDDDREWSAVVLRKA